MAILTGPEIRRQMLLGNIVIRPEPMAIGPNSADLRLASLLKTYRNRILDPRKEMPTDEIEIPPSGLMLEPGKLYLGSTLEWTETRCHVPYLDGRSSAGRLGIQIHCTAGRGDVGFRGHWTCEISVIHPVLVFREMPLMQITYHTVEGRLQPYAGRYQGDMDAQGCKLRWQ